MAVAKVYIADLQSVTVEVRVSKVLSWRVRLGIFVMRVGARITSMNFEVKGADE